jgi:hypothetical protein
VIRKSLKKMFLLKVSILGQPMEKLQKVGK